MKVYNFHAKNVSGDSVLKVEGITDCNVESFKRWMEREGYTVDVLTASFDTASPNVKTLSGSSPTAGL